MEYSGIPQNPFGSSGTQRLPQSQMDRFLVRLSMGYPDKESEIMILKGKGIISIDSVSAVLSAESLEQLQQECKRVYVSDELYEYIVNISNATRGSSLFDMGISPRGSIAVLKLSKANAFMDGRDYVVPEDITDIITYATAHRIELSEKAVSMQYTAEDAVTETLKSVKLRASKK